MHEVIKEKIEESTIEEIILNKLNTLTVESFPISMMKVFIFMLQVS